MNDNVVECYRCGYTWTKRVKRPKQCPWCNSKRWDVAPESIEELISQFERLPEIQKSEVLQTLTKTSSTRNEGGGEYNEGENNE